MMIMRFHKLIQSKLLWLFFLGVVVTTFVFWGAASQAGSDQQNQRLNQTVARIGGEDISFLKFDVTRRLLEMQARGRLPEEMAREATLNHLATVAYAESIGLDIPREFAARQFAMNFTDENGNLDEQALANFRAGIGNSMISESDYIEFTREQLLLNSLSQLLAGTLLVPDLEAERFAGVQTDEFTIQYAPVGPEVLPDDLTVTDEQVAEFFEQNPSRFTLPEERIVRYLTVSTDAFRDTVDPVTDEEARARYNSSPDAYTRTVETPAAEEGGEPTTTREPIPFQEVADQIKEDLMQERLEKAASELAMSLAVKMTPRRGKPGQSMEELAEAEGLEIVTTPAFSQGTPLPGPANAAPFKQAAFKLDESKLGRRGGPVRVANDFVVLELQEILPPRQPELDEVRDRVRVAATAAERRKALAAKAEEIAGKIREAVAGGADFESAAKEFELNVLSPDPLQLQTLNPRMPILPPELVRELPAHLPGDVIGPVESRFGGLFFAYLADRQAQMVAREELIPEMKETLASRIQFQSTFARFQEQVITPMIEEL